MGNILLATSWSGCVSKSGCFTHSTISWFTKKSNIEWVFSICFFILKGNVSIPCIKWNALVGDKEGPKLYIPSALIIAIKADGPNSSQKLIPPRAKCGPEIVGNLSLSPQSKLPPFTIAPPIAIPWPPNHLVSEWTIILAPCLNGCIKYGVLKVASSTRGIFFELHILAISGTSIISNPGLPITSPNTNLVFGFIAFLIASGSLGLTKSVLTPKRGIVCWSKLIFAPYILLDATIWSPLLQIAETTRCIAAIPLEHASALAPPSRAANLCSSAATVGFDILVYKCPPTSILYKDAASSVLLKS